METLGSELNPKTLKPGSEFQKCQMKGPVQVKNPVDSSTATKRMNYFCITAHGRVN